MGRTDKREVSKNSPRRKPLDPLPRAALLDGVKKALPDIPPVTERTGPRQALLRRAVPLSHNHGDPIVKPKLPPELRKDLRKAAKKAKRKRLCDLQQNPPPASRAAQPSPQNPLPPPAAE